MVDTRLVRTCVGGDDHTLVLRRSDDPTGFDPMFDLLPADDPTDMLAITYHRPDRFLARWRERTDQRPRNVGVLGVGERTRSASATPERTASRSPTFRGIADPTDVDRISEAAGRFLESWQFDGRTVACFESATALLSHVDLEDAVAGLRTLRRTLDAHDATGYVSLTPSAHACRVVREVTSLFDTVVECVERTAEPASTPTVSDCVDVMADARRRVTLAEVAGADAVDVDDLADRVAARTSTDSRQIQLSLVNVHLPKLAELGIVAYDRDRGRVAVGEHFDRVEPYLRRAVGEEVGPRR